MTPAPIIVSAAFGSADFAWLDGLRRDHFPPARNQIAAHLTLFHHLPPSLLDELTAQLGQMTRNVPRPAAAIGKPMLLGRGVALRVHSDALVALRAELADAFHGVLTPQDRAGWRPHVTIQNKVDPAVAKALHGEIERDPRIARPLSIIGIAIYFYRDGPWEPIACHRFAG